MKRNAVFLAHYTIECLCRRLKRKCFFIMEQPIKSASCGTGQLEIGPCHVMFLKSVISSNFALLFLAQSVAVSVGLITAAAAAYARRLYVY